MEKLLTIYLIMAAMFTIHAQEDIQNKLTEKHQTIAGKKVSLIIPTGFLAATSFSGFQHEESSSNILFFDVPEQFSEISKSVNKEDLHKTGVEVEKIEYFNINSIPAILVTGTQDANGSIYGKLLLIFGTEKETIIINGVYPKKETKIGDEIKKSMLSVYYDSDKIIDPFEAFDFTIDVSTTKLKFGKSMPNALYFSVDGEVPTKSDNKTNLFVAKQIRYNQTGQKQYVIELLETVTPNLQKIEEPKEITIDGLKGYEISALSKNTKTKKLEKSHQVILFSDNFYYLLLGTTNDDTKSSINEIKKAILTFKRK